jgi:dTMP kinase
MLVVIEGLDGAGKSLQTKLLKQALGAYQCHTAHFPTDHHSLFGAPIAQFLRGDLGSLEVNHPILVALLFACDQFAHKSLLEQSGVVILDRYYYSNIAYQVAKLVSLVEKAQVRDWLDQVITFFTLPKPDIAFYLDMPFSFIQNNLETPRQGEHRNYLQGTAIDIHEADLAFQQEVAQEYRLLTERFGEFKLITCVDEAGHIHSPQAVHQTILALITPFL